MQWMDGKHVSHGRQVWMRVGWKVGSRYVYIFPEAATSPAISSFLFLPSVSLLSLSSPSLGHIGIPPLNHSLILGSVLSPACPRFRCSHTILAYRACRTDSLCASATPSTSTTCAPPANNCVFHITLGKVNLRFASRPRPTRVPLSSAHATANSNAPYPRLEAATMTLQAAYKQFLAAPNSSLLADEATLHYITTTTAFKGATDIIKHLGVQRSQIKKTKEDVLAAIEGPAALALELDTAFEFVLSGGTYLPGLDDNFLADRAVNIPIVSQSSEVPASSPRVPAPPPSRLTPLCSRRTWSPSGPTARSYRFARAGTKALSSSRLMSSARAAATGPSATAKTRSK